MILRLHPEQNLHWITAIGLSVVVHIGALATLFDLWPGSMSSAPSPLLTPDISVSTVILDDGTIEGMENLQQFGNSETVSGADPDAEMLPAAQPDPEALKPEEIKPVSPVEITRLNPIRPEEGTALKGVAPVEMTPERLAAVQQHSVETTPPAVAPAPQTAEEIALNELVKNIRDRLGDSCLVALPRLQNDGEPLVTIIATQDRAINTFAQDVLNDGEEPIEHRPVLIDARQCPALNLARENANYPSFRLSMSIRTPIVSSGGHLVGSIKNVAGMYTSLLLIDDNGVVQDLRRFTSFVSGRADFDVPVTRDGSARDTSQLLFAVATQKRQNIVSQYAGRLAEDFFPALQNEIGSGAMIALVPFEVR